VIYFKSAIVGILTALVATLVVTFALTRVAYGAGSGAVSVSIAEWQILTAGSIGFAAGFWWALRRSRTLRRA
jgi:hypothetical protein